MASVPSGSAPRSILSDSNVNSMNNFSIASFNVRGLRDRKKRRTIFRHLHLKYRNHIVILLETHSSSDNEAIWQNEWGSPVLFSHGTVHQAGVAVLIPRSFQGVIRDNMADTEGRVVGVRLEVGNHRIAVLGIYAPAIDIQEEKIAFFEKVRNILTDFNEVFMIIGGDFNVHMGIWDVEEGKFNETSASSKLEEITEEFCLVDIWRHQNPRTRNFTWRRLNPTQQSRIDYIFISAAFQLEFDVHSSIAAGIRSDHSVVDIVAVPAGRQRGPGLWRYNNELHESDQIFVESAREEIARARNEVDPYDADASIGVKVEMLLSNIRVLSIRRGKAIAFELRKEETELLKQVTIIEKDISELDEQQKGVYMEARQRLDGIKTKRGVQAIIASGVKWLEQGERATSYFLSRGKQLSALKTITKINDNGHLIVGDCAILQHCANHYSKVFTAMGVNKSKMCRFLENYNIPKLNEVERQQCDGLIASSECRFALSTMHKNKAPGVTGFTAEFFLFFWDDIGEYITDYINDAYENGFFITQKRGIITLIPKKGDQTVLQNKRPICLLDVIYKIAAKVIANRVGKVIHKLVSPEQTGFIKGRFIGENLRLTSDIIDYCELDRSGGILMACDYRAAFDSLEHEFVLAALKAYNFGESLMQWVKLLYGDAQLAITNNGFTSAWFKCDRGTFQGSPLSGILFDLALEILAINVRANHNIRGIIISDVEIKLSLYADDITAFLRDQDAAETFISVMDDFREASGLALNMEKSNVMWLGTDKHREDSIREISAVKTVKTLGIYFSASEKCVSKNVDPICRKIENVINIWSQRTLTLKGRITVCKSLIASQLVYLCACVKIPQRNIAVLQSKIMRFLWRGRPPKVSQRILCQNIEDGGLNAVNLTLFCKSLKLGWIRRLHTCNESPWCRLLQARIGKYNLTDMLQTCLGADDIKRLRIPAFYKELLTEFQNYSYRPTDSKMNILKELLWYNRSIRSAGKTLFINDMYQAGIKMVGDLTREDGSIMTLGELKCKLPRVRVDFLTYGNLIRGIPRIWKEKLNSGSYQQNTDNRNELFDFPIGKKMLKISEMRSSHFYKAHVGQETPSAVARWEHYGYTVSDWEKVFQIPYKCTKWTKLQTLQYRILNRFLPTRRYLLIRNVVDTPKCRQCNREDTLEHFLFTCDNVKPIWNFVFNKLNRADINSVETVIFGTTCNKPAINLLILLAKQYIVHCKLAKNILTPAVQGLTHFIIYNVDIERQNAIANNKLLSFSSKWYSMVDASGKFHLFNNTQNA